MKKVVIIILLSLLISTSSLYSFAGGDGSSGNPYQVATADHLNDVRDYLDKYFIQTANIVDLSSTYSNWEPIGTLALPFIGHYNGDGYWISGLTINRSSTPNVGLFGCIGVTTDNTTATSITKLGLTTVNVIGARGTGSLVGRVKGNSQTLIEQCYVYSGTVIGDGATGGLVGANNSYVENPANKNYNPVISECYADVSVSWSKSGLGDKIGGLTGCNQKGIIRDSYARGSVTVDNDPSAGSPDRMGGLAGCILIRGYIENSYSTGLVYTEGTVLHVGGFVGNGGGGGSDGNTYDCFWDTQTSTRATSSPTSGCTGKTTAEMKTESTYTDAGWDFTNIWSFSEGNYPVLRYVIHPEPKTITLTDGSSFSPSVTPGSTDQPIGRFSLSASDTGSELSRVTIRLDGTRTGASNFKLWKSANSTFGSDTQLGSTVVTDPGDAKTVSFSFNEGLTTTMFYYFLTCDVAGGATGSIEGYLTDNTSLTFYDGVISATITDAPLSSGAATLPVELSTFTGQYINSVPTLYWSTQTETDNLGWNVYRNKDNDFTSADRINGDLIPGHGTTSQVQNYVYKDINGTFDAGENYWYWLESIDYGGTVNHYNRVALIHIPEIQNPDPHSAVPRKYGLQSGPNPFNSNLSVSYMLHQTDMVRVEIYNMTGQLVAQFNEGLRTADREYIIDWDGKDLYGQNVASGVLLIKLITSEGSETTKAILLR